MNQKVNKREQLIKSAFELFQEHPYQSATLAMLAEKAEIPLGNIYYYFKSKELLLEAVIDFFVTKIRSRLVECQNQSSSKARLKLFLQYYMNDTAHICRWGDPIFGLTRSLPPAQEEKVQEFLDLIQKWIIQQFQHEPHPQMKGLNFMHRLYGIVALAGVHKDCQLYQKHLNQLLTELDLY